MGAMMSDRDFPLEKQVPSRELCEQLRDAGFPQGTVWYWETCQRKPEHVVLTLRNRQVAGGVYVAAPLVGEMREWLREHEIDDGDFAWHPNCFVDCSKAGIYTFADSDAQAHALTCLALLKAMKAMKEEQS